MSVCRAIHRAYAVAAERNWDSVYWALDLHGTCFTSNYESSYNWILDDLPDLLRKLTSYPETKLILWSSVHDADKAGILKLFADERIPVFGFNQNPEVGSTNTGNFDEKFYMSVIVDDKAGFDPSEWHSVLDVVSVCRRSMVGVNTSAYGADVGTAQHLSLSNTTTTDKSPVSGRGGSTTNSDSDGLLDTVFDALTSFFD